MAALATVLHSWSQRLAFNLTFISMCPWQCVFSQKKKNLLCSCPWGAKSQLKLYIWASCFLQVKVFPCFKCDLVENSPMCLLLFGKTAIPGVRAWEFFILSMKDSWNSSSISRRQWGSSAAFKTTNKKSSALKNAQNTSQSLWMTEHLPDIKLPVVFW